MQKFSNKDEFFKNAPMAKFVKRLQQTGKYSYLALVLYYPIYLLGLSPDQDVSYIPLALFWLPMLFAVKGIVKGNPYTYAWSNFILMWCFMHGLTALWTFEGNKLWVLIENTLLLTAFIGNTYFARYRGRELGMALPKIKELKEKEKQQFERK